MEAIANLYGPLTGIPEISSCSKEHPDKSAITTVAVNTKDKFY